MVIKKNVVLTENKKLVEADEKTVTLDPIDLDNTTDEIADELSGQVAVTTGKEPNGANVKDAADLAKEAGDKIGTDEVIVDGKKDIFANSGLRVENAMTKKLDLALQKAVQLKNKGSANRANVLICGLPGSGKTASIYDWAERATVNGEPVNVVYINAKNNDLEAWLNGYTSINPDNAHQVTQLTSDNLTDLEEPNSILFIDEYNRQTKDQVRASLLTLINEHYVQGNSKINPNDKKGRHYFKNFLFTIAAMNPPLGLADKGAVPLNGAEKSRFVFTMKNADSDPETCEAYLKKQYDKYAAKAIHERNDYDEAYRMLLTQYIGIGLVTDDDFKFSNVNDAIQCAKNQTNIVNQRLITGGLDMWEDDIDSFIDWINGDADLEPKDAQMITDILTIIKNDLEDVTRDDLFEARAPYILEDYGIDILDGNNSNNVADADDDTDTDAGAANTANAAADDDDEVEDIWTTPTTSASGKTVVSPGTAKAKLTGLKL